MPLNYGLESDMQGEWKAHFLLFMSHYTDRDHMDPVGDFFFSEWLVIIVVIVCDTAQLRLQLLCL